MAKKETAVIKHPTFRSQMTVTSAGNIEFDADGEAKVSRNQFNFWRRFPGVEVIEDPGKWADEPINFIDGIVETPEEDDEPVIDTPDGMAAVRHKTLRDEVTATPYGKTSFDIYGVAYLDKESYAFWSKNPNIEVISAPDGFNGYADIREADAIEKQTKEIAQAEQEEADRKKAEHDAQIKAPKPVVNDEEAKPAEKAKSTAKPAKGKLFCDKCTGRNCTPAILAEYKETGKCEAAEQK